MFSKSETPSEPIVSVCIVTWNQESLIEECLNSVINQEVSFAFEIIVGVDYSDDKTAEVVKRVANANPSLVRALFHPKRVGPTENYRSIHAMALGKFVAHIDGDDYAYPRKLAMQTRELECNESVGICGHSMDLVDLNGRPLNKTFPTAASNRLLALSDALLVGPLFGHSSYMYRRSLAAHIFQSNDEAIDYRFLVGFLLQSEGILIAECLGAYRIASSGTLTESWAGKKVGLVLDAYLDIATAKPEMRALVSAAVFAEAGRRFLFSRSLCKKMLLVLWTCRCIPSLRTIIGLRTARRGYMRLLNEAFLIA